MKRLLLEPKNIGIASGFAVLVAVASGLWTHSAAIRSASQQDDNQNKVTNTQQLQSDHTQKSAQAQTDAPQASSQQNTNTNQQNNNSGSAASTTTPQSFSTAITRPGQVAAGTLISYNSNKNEKTYYGGDLALSVATMTISKSNPTMDSRTVTISSPDGQVLSAPASPWDDKSPYFWIAADSSNTKTSGTSFDMFVDFSSNVPNGTYQLHLTTGRAQQSTDGWRYDNFITINVVD
ncbi:MAG TPA: hypothetical protein VJ843_01735 [Candidatus Saccharimonadales bacterium]|nr:hypothetical protein [Candidatus Saccharimonadales bacterium]